MFAIVIVGLLWLALLGVVVAFCSAAARADRRDRRFVVRPTASGSG